MDLMLVFFWSHWVYIQSMNPETIYNPTIFITTLSANRIHAIHSGKHLDRINRG